MKNLNHFRQRLYLIIFMVLMAATGFAQQPQTGDVIYVYQKDGGILSFLREEIIEMTYSNVGIDNTEYEEPVTQWVITEDSVYKIALSDIDSISFVTPPTVYQPDVTRIEQGLMQYVLSSDSLTFTVDKSVPTNLLPKIGDKLVTTEMNDKFPIGFAGEVVVVADGGTFYTIACDAVDLEDIFETYYDVSVAEGTPEESSNNNDQQSRKRAISISKTFKYTLPTFSSALGAELSENVGPLGLALKYGTKFEVSAKPTIRTKLSLIIDKKKGTQFSGSIGSDIDMTKSLSFYGGLNWNVYFGIEVVKVPICKFIHLYFKPGVFIDADLLASLASVKKQTFNSTFSFSYNSKAKNNPAPKLVTKQTSSSFDTEGCIEGRVAYGFFGEYGLTILASMFDHLAVRSEFGTEYVGNAVVTEDDAKLAGKSTGLYEALKKAKVEHNLYVEQYIDYKDLKKSISSAPSLSIRKNIDNYVLVPEFSNMEFVRDETTGDASATVSGKCLKPLTVGLMVTDKDGNLVDSWNANDKYEKGGQQISTKFTGLKEDEDYVLYPKIVFYGFDVMATPSTDLTKDDFPVHIIDFRQTGSDYSPQQGYEYDGRYYYYKFNATTTVELDKDAKNIKDWGYFYRDFYGEDKKISCANLGSNPYADERYAYYYNDPHRTVELYAYVQYEGETTIKTGRHKIFPVQYEYKSVSACPDDKHPHAIDLGLPSGTLWSCCNVGARVPEEDGDYYRWGATEPIKDGVNQWYTGDMEDIAGTEYDVAHVKWGGDWCMPTWEQINELKQYCAEKQQNNPNQDPWWQISKAMVHENGWGSHGCWKVIGPNGNNILLPAAGVKSSETNYFTPPMNDDSTNKYKSCDYFINYWTSTDSWYYDDNNNVVDAAWALRCVYVYSSYTNVDYGFVYDNYVYPKDMAMPVRPVMKKK